MLVVIPFCAKDEDVCVKQIEWSLKISGKDKRTALVVHDDTVTGHAVVTAAKRAFSSVEEFQYPKWPGKQTHWPIVQNHQFQETATFLYNKRNGKPWFWWEPDCTPLKEGWLDALEREYNEGGKPFMGHIVSGDPFQNGKTIEWMTGCGIYPWNVIELSSSIMSCINVPWDVAGGSQILGKTHRANHLIQHVWERNGAPFSFRDRRDADSVLSKTAVVFHRCKDGSLIDALNGEPFGVTIARALKEKIEECASAARKLFAVGGKTAVVQLGRYGDIANALPAVRMIGARTGAKPSVIVSKEFASILDGVKYCDAIPYEGHFSDLRGGIDFAQCKFKDVIVGQVWGKDSPVEQKCSSYNMDNWERLGCLSQWTDPTPPTFDNRDRKRERLLINSHVQINEKPLMILSLSGGVTSKLEGGDVLSQKVKQAFGDMWRIVDIDTIMAERIYDVIGLMEIADAIVTSDTVWLHLANDVSTPVAAVLSQKGDWMQTVPRCNCTLMLKDTSPSSENRLFKWIEDRQKSVENRLFIQVCEEHFPKPKRVKRAQSTWRSLEATYRWKVVYASGYNRDARQIGEKRDLPFIKDVIQYGLDRCSHDDVLVFTNDDTILAPHTPDEINRTLAASVALSSNRSDLNSFVANLPREPHTSHIGRDLMAFKASWLRRNIDMLPDYLIGICDWDIGMAAQIRWLAGEEWSIKTSSTPMISCELLPGSVFHEKHEPTWTDDRKGDVSPGLAHNRREVKRWAASAGVDISQGITWWNKS